jgi:hypothetical protein
MKRKFLPFAILSLTCFFYGHAQISKGSIFLGGQINFNSQVTTYAAPGANNSNINSFNFSPAIGKAIKDNTVVGVDLNYVHTGYKQDISSYDQTSNMYGAGVFMRHYVLLGKGFYVFGQGRFGASYNTGKATQPALNGPSDDMKGFSLNFGFYPGISYQVSKKLQLETGFNNLAFVNFQHSKDTQTGTGASPEFTTNNFSIGTSLNNLASFTLGFRVLLSK